MFASKPLSLQSGGYSAHLDNPAVAHLAVIGEADLLRFAGSQLLTWRGIRRVLVVVGGLTLFAWAKHLAWYQDEPPPIWFRRSVWLNVLEGFILLGVIVVGAWAFLRFAPSPLPSR